MASIEWYGPAAFASTIKHDIPGGSLARLMALSTLLSQSLHVTVLQAFVACWFLCCDVQFSLRCSAAFHHIMIAGAPRHVSVTSSSVQGLGGS